MLRRYAARLLSSSVEFKRQTEGVVDGPEFIETHAANKFAEPFRSYRRRLFDESGPIVAAFVTSGTPRGRRCPVCQR